MSNNKAKRKKQRHRQDRVKKGGQFGVTSEDTKKLRALLKEAAEKNSEEVVLRKLGITSMDAVRDSISTDMTRSQFGSMKNALRKLCPRTKTNKYETSNE